MARPTKIDWVKAETDYVTGSMSYPELAEKYKVSEKGLARKAGVKKWVMKRGEYRSARATQAIENQLNHDALDKQQFDEHTNIACDGIVAMIARHVVADEVSASRAKDIMQTIKTIQEIKYRTLNVPNPTQPIDYQRKPSPIEDIEDEIQAALKEGRIIEAITIMQPGGNSGGNGEPN